MTNGFRHTTEFRQVQIKKPKNLEEALNVIGTIGEELNRTHNKLQDSFTRLQGSVGKTGDTTVIVGGGVNSTTNTTVTGADLRANSVAVVAGANVITFATPMTQDYVIMPIYVTPNYIGFIDPTQIVYTMSGFTVTVDVAGILIYAVIPKTL
jgi:hypothetical protein